MLKVVLGLVSLVVGVALLAAGVLGIVTFGTSGTLEAVSTPLKSNPKSYALVADVIGIDTGFPGSSSLGTTTLGAQSTNGKRLFIGVGPRDAVDEYLLGVPFDAVRQDGSAWQTQTVPGTNKPAPPANERFWLRRGTGIKPTVEFVTPGSGMATYVIMNGDGTPAVAARMTMGFSSPSAFPLSIAAIIIGGLAALLGLFLLLRRRRGPGADAPAVTGADQAIRLPEDTPTSVIEPTTDEPTTDELTAARPPTDSSRQ